MLHRLMRRLRLAFYVVTGRLILPYDLEGIELMVALTKTTAALAALSAAADRAIAKAQDDSAVASAAAAALAEVDDATSTQVQAVVDKLDAYAPPPPPEDVLDLATAEQAQA